MDYEKLIDGLKNSKGPDNCHDCALGYWALMGATALSTLQTENEKLRDEVERQRRSADNRQHLYENAERAYMKVLAELEQARAEITRLKHYEDKCHDCPIVCAKTEIIKAHEELEQIQSENDRLRKERDAAVENIPHECKTCLYHTVSFNGCTPDHDCTNLDGGCSNNYDRWKWCGIKEDRHEAADIL